MNKLCILLLFMSLVAFGCHAQNNKVDDLINEMATPKPGEGKVTIKQPQAVKQELSKPQSQSENSSKGVGYRINVFSGNNPKNSKTIAYERAEQIKEIYPEAISYISFKSPNWRLRVGDFTTYEEAHELLRQLRIAFPKFGKELFIVKDEINL